MHSRAVTTAVLPQQPMLFCVKEAVDAFVLSSIEGCGLFQSLVNTYHRSQISPSQEQGKKWLLVCKKTQTTTVVQVLLTKDYFIVFCSVVVFMT